MVRKSRRHSKSDSLKNRHKTEMENRGTGGTNYGVLDYDKAGIEGNITKFKPKSKKTYHIDIMPFEISEKMYRKFRNRKGNILGTEVGELDFKLEIPVHQKIGPENKTIVCTKALLGQPCYICDERDNLEDENEQSALWVKWRDFYNIRDLEEEEKGNQLFEAAYSIFENELQEKAEISSDEGVIIFSHLEEGMTVTFRGADKTVSQKGQKPFTFTMYKDFGFEERDDPYDEDILNESLPLDKMLIIHSYEEQRNIFIGMDDNEDEKEETTERKSKRSRKSEPDPKENEDDIPLDPGNDNPDCFGIEFERIESCDECDKNIWNACGDKKKELEKGDNPDCFGIEYEKKDACEDCNTDIWEDCGDRKEELEKEKEAKEEKKSKRSRRKRK